MKRFSRVWLLVPAALVVIGAAGVLALTVGSPATDLPAVAALLREHLLHGPPSPSAERLERLAHIAVLEVRLPRLVLALLIGAALGCAGALMQDTLRNPLASPDLLGVSAGASLVTAAIAILHLPAGPLGPALPAALVGLAVGLLVLAVSRGRAGETLVLFGAACTAMLNGLVVAVVSLGAPSDVGLLFQYLMGSLAGRTWADVQLVAPAALLGIPLALLLGRRLDVLRLGDDVASGLGVEVGRTRLVAMVLGCVLVAGTVAVAGPIGFVALLAPHAVRGLTGRAQAVPVLLLSALTGAAMLLLADAVGRALVHPREIAVGIWCALAGCPAVLVALRRLHV